ncbi:MAG: hypothetical protein U0R80_13680 [Nocardioidaceae bacterium]
MSLDSDRTPLEARLAAALAARAELVQPEVLTARSALSDGPSAPSRAWWYVAAAAGLALAVGVTVVAVRGGGRDDSGPVIDVPGTRGAIFADVDGDGERDRLSIDGDTLRIELASGDVAAAHLPADARLLGAAHVAAGGVTGSAGSEIVVIVPAPEKAWDLRLFDVNGTEVSRLVDGPTRQVTATSTFWIAQGRLFAGRWDAADDPGARGVQAATLQAGIDSLFFTEVGEWCWDSESQRAPGVCGPGGAPAVSNGDDEDLPTLFPAADERWIRPGGPTLHVKVRGSGLGSDIRASLRPRAEGAELDVQYERGGYVWRADVPGPDPALADISRIFPMFVVASHPDEDRRIQVYALTGSLGPLALRGGPPVLSGTPAGESASYDFWVSEEGGMFSRRAVSGQDGRFEVWRWSLGSVKHTAVLQAQPLGEVCIDLTAEPVRYGRCGG